MIRVQPLLCGIMAIAAISASSNAAAVNVARNDFQGAVGLCKAALPVNNAGLRNRPLGIANESTASVFVTCNWQGDDSQNTVRGATQVSIVFSNTSSAAQNVSCTLVNGFQQGTNLQATYTPKSVSIAPGQSGTIAWVPSEVSGAATQIKQPAASCLLPPASTLQFTGKNYMEDIGS